MTPRLDVRLLGRPAIRVRGRMLRLAGRHAQALFALLVLDRRSRSREAVATELWPDAGVSAAPSLRQALWLVRTTLSDVGVDPDALLEIGPDAIGLRADARVSLDVERFEHLLCGPGSDAEAAIDLYHGDLAEGLGHECFAAERERLSDAYEDALALAAARRLATGDLATARSYADRLLARDPLREEAHSVLMEVYGLGGTRSQVVRQYRRLRAILRHELDVEPLPETDAAYRRALGRTVEESRRRAAATAFVVPDYPSRLIARG